MNPPRFGVRRVWYCLVTILGIAENWCLKRSRRVARGKAVMIGDRRGDQHVHLFQNAHSPGTIRLLPHPLWGRAGVGAMEGRIAFAKNADVAALDVIIYFS